MVWHGIRIETLFFRRHEKATHAFVVFIVPHIQLIKRFTENWIEIIELVQEVKAESKKFRAFHGSVEHVLSQRKDNLLVSVEHGKAWPGTLRKSRRKALRTS